MPPDMSKPTCGAQLGRQPSRGLRLGPLRELQKSGSLPSYLSSVGTTASRMLEHAMAQMLIALQAASS